MDHSTYDLAIPLAAGVAARVPFPMSEEDFQLLMETLALWKKRLVNPEPTAAELNLAEALRGLADSVEEIKGQWTESIDNWMQQAEEALRPYLPPKSPWKMEDSPPPSCPRCGAGMLPRNVPWGGLECPNCHYKKL
jgi:hypothetical protein